MTKHIGGHLAMASFVLGMLCFAVILLLFVSLLPYEAADDVVGTIAFYLFPVSPPFAFVAALLGIIGYHARGQQDGTKSRKYALWGVALSLVYWILFAVQYIVRIPGYGW